VTDPVARVVATRPFDDQKPGTSGLRKKTPAFMRAHYLENFVQATLDVVLAGRDPARETLVVGGDGRYHNRAAAQTIVRMAAANGLGRVLVARDALLSTPAASAVIRARGALGGFVLSASHNPGGLDGDFGIKFNGDNGGPATEELGERMYRATLAISQYRTLDCPDLDLASERTIALGGTQVEVFDGVAEHAALMARLFDFDALRAWFAAGHRVHFDAMNGITGPYATEVLERRLGAPPGTVRRGTPLEDFGGIHPDPNLVYAADLVAAMAADDAPELGAACDGDGDRNLVLGPGAFVSPGDSLALITEHAARIPAYRGGLRGVARSMPTSTAADRVAAALGIDCYETPTGWKFFGDLLDAGRCTLCGEESFGTGSDHVREKDGLWAVLCWISMLADTGQPVADLLAGHWRRFGRSYFQRHDFEALDLDGANAMFAELRARLPALAGTALADRVVVLADDFSYTSPVSGAVSSRGGVRVVLDDGSRIVMRLSGTGTEGATLRVYLERVQADFGQPVDRVLEPLRAAALVLTGLPRRFGREVADVVT